MHLAGLTRAANSGDNRRLYGLLTRLVRESHDPETMLAEAVNAIATLTRYSRPGRVTSGQVDGRLPEGSPIKVGDLVTALPPSEFAGKIGLVTLVEQVGAPAPILVDFRLTGMLGKQAFTAVQLQHFRWS